MTLTFITTRTVVTITTVDPEEFWAVCGEDDSDETPEDCARRIITRDAWDFTYDREDTGIGETTTVLHDQSVAHEVVR